MSHIPIDLVDPLTSSSLPLLLPVSWFDNVGEFHIVGMRCPHKRYLRGGKRYHLLLFLPRKFSLLVNMCEKFVLACLSRQISG